MVDTLGSVWAFDEELLVYIRMPRNEGPRPSPPGQDWGGPGAGMMQDLVWHPYIEWRLEPMPDYGVEVRHADGSWSTHHGNFLIIDRPDGNVRAPCAFVR